MAKRIYATGKLTTKTEEHQEVLRSITGKMERMRNVLSESDYTIWHIGFYEYLRRKLQIPNKIFTFATSKADNTICILIFDASPDDNTYVVKIDEEKHLPYIEILEESE